MNILICLPKKPLQNAITKAAHALGFKVYKLDNSQEIMSVLPRSDDNSTTLLFCHSEDLTQLDGIFQHTSEVKVCVLGDIGAFYSELPKLKNCKKASFFHYSLPPDTINDFNSLIKDMTVMLKKLQDSNIFGLNKYLGYGSHIDSRKIHNKKEKEEVIDRVFQWIVKIAPENLAENFEDQAIEITESLDELILNAIFHANPRLQGVPLHTSYDLDSDEAVLVQWGFDGKFFGVSVADAFGRLEKEKILCQLNEKRESRLNARTGGRGIKSIFANNQKVIVNVVAGSTTEVILLRELFTVRKTLQFELFDYFQKA